MPKSIEDSDSKGLHGSIVRGLIVTRKRIEKQSREIRDILLALSGNKASISDFTYEVVLESCYKSDGEYTVTRYGRGSLAEVAQRAVRDFKRINGRRKVYAQVSASVKFGRGRNAFRISLPEELVTQHFG